MGAADRPITEAKAALFKALAHPARVRVLELLSQGEHTMGELVELTGLEASHLSQHVTVLRRAGVVDSRRVKTSVICTLRDPQTVELLAVARRMLSHQLRESHALLAALDDGADETPPSPTNPGQRPV